MPDISFVKKQIEDSYLIWFQNSNLYFQLQEPAWFVFDRLTKDSGIKTIAKEFSNLYSIPYENSLNFVKEIKHNVDEVSKPYENVNRQYHEEFENEINNHTFIPYSKHSYKIFNKTIEFSYETSWLENSIHPMIKHLEIPDKTDNKSYFELYTYKDRVILKTDNTLKGSWTKDESEYVKGRIFIELINVLHNKTEADWLMTVHASAISNGNKTILFSAEPGSGKTTMAALLKAHGYQIISDDFVPIEQSSFKAYPLPVAMSVKEGSFEILKPYFPELETNPFVTLFSQKKVKYLPINNNTMQLVFPANEFVFIKYDKSVDCRLEKIHPLEGIKRLLDETWIPATPNNVEIFLEKIISISYYCLTYSDNQKAINAVSRLFQNEE